MKVDTSLVKFDLKDLNNSIQEYLTTKSDEKAAHILDAFKVFSESTNQQAFNANNRDSLNFFLNLYEIIRGSDAQSVVLWSAVDVLEVVTKHPQTKECLIETFKFVPALTKLINSKLPWERTLKILQLIQELTYGIKISWQEAHLHSLISSLTKWITEDDPALIPLALGILVNLCFKNTPAMYVLMKVVDIRKFLKILFKLRKNNPQCKVQVCKLLIILEDVSGGLPDVEVEAYIRSTCPSLAEAIHHTNTPLMKHIQNFFKEIIHMGAVAKAISNYPSYAEDIEKLLNIVLEEENINSECLGALFDYFCSVVDLKVFGLEALYPQMIKLACTWIHVETASSDALILTSKIIESLFTKQDDIPSEQQMVIDSVSQILDGKLPEIIHLLNRSEALLGSLESTRHSQLSSVIHLLTQLVRIPTFYSVITEYIDLQVVTKLFDPLLGNNFNEHDLFQKPMYSFHIEALCFTAALSDVEPSWLVLYNNLLQETQIQMVLSIALYIGSEAIKKKVLALTGTSGFSSNCLDLLAGHMYKLNKLVCVSPPPLEKEDPQSEFSVGAKGFSSVELMPLLTVTQLDQLNSVLERCEQAARKNENTLTSSIMELYQYKNSVMEQNQRQALANQEAADEKAGQLQVRLSQAGAELSRLYGLLYSTQLALEEKTRETNALSSRLADYCQELSDLKRRQEIIFELASGKGKV